MPAWKGAGAIRGDDGPQGQNWKEPPDSEPCPRPAGSEGQARAPVLLGLGRKRRCEGASFSRRTDSGSAWAGRQPEAPGLPTCLAHTEPPVPASPLFPCLPRAPSCSTKGMCDFSSEDERKCRIGDSPLFKSIKPTNLEIRAGIQRGGRQAQAWGGAPCGSDSTTGQGPLLLCVLYPSAQWVLQGRAAPRASIGRGAQEAGTGGGASARGARCFLGKMSWEGWCQELHTLKGETLTSSGLRGPFVFSCY